MTVTFTVRGAARGLLEANLVPPALPSGTPVYYVYPEDDDPDGAGPVELATFPTILIQKGLYSISDPWRAVTQVDMEYTWWLEIIAFLGQKDLPDWEAVKMAEDWAIALINVFAPQPTINGTVERIDASDSGEKFYTRDGHYDWYTQDSHAPNSYFGVGLRMRVVQSVAYAETVGVEA